MLFRRAIRDGYIYLRGEARERFQSIDRDGRPPVEHTFALQSVDSGQHGDRHAVDFPDDTVPLARLDARKMMKIRVAIALKLTFAEEGTILQITVISLAPPQRTIDKQQYAIHIMPEGGKFGAETRLPLHQLGAAGPAEEIYHPLLMRLRVIAVAIKALPLAGLQRQCEVRTVICQHARDSDGRADQDGRAQAGCVADQMGIRVSGHIRIAAEGEFALFFLKGGHIPGGRGQGFV